MRNARLLIALSVVGALALSTGIVRGSITVNPDGSYDVTTNSMGFHYLPDGTISLSQFGVSSGGAGRHIVFASIVGGPFNPTQPPTEHGRTVSVAGQRASLEAHDSPHATLVYNAVQPGNVTLTLDSGVGAVTLGSKAFVGDSRVQADLIVTNGRTISKVMDSLMVHLQPDDSVVFRVQGPAGSLGDLFASGAVGAELDVKTKGGTIDADLTSYESGTSLAVEMVGSSRASFTYSGLQSGSVVIIDLSPDLYAPLKDHLTASLGGSTLDRYASVQELGQRNGFVIAEGQDYAEMIVRTGSSSGTLVIENATNSVNAMLAVAALASAVISVAAAFYLFRRKSQ